MMDGCPEQREVSAIGIGQKYQPRGTDSTHSENLELTKEHPGC